MAEPSIFFAEVNERQGVFHRRAFLLGGFAGVGLLALGGRLAHLQLIETQRPPNHTQLFNEQRHRPKLRAVWVIRVAGA